MSPIYTRFARRIGVLRESQGMTRRDLAWLLTGPVASPQDVDAKAIYVARVETGQHEAVTLDEVEELADALNVTPAVLLDGVL